MNKKLTVSICIPAHNEEGNIYNLLHSLVNQETKKIEILNISVISSGSTDKTDEITKQFSSKYKIVHLYRQRERRGKVAAINYFLRRANSEVVVLQSADTIATKDTIEHLCKEFVTNPDLGLTGGAPYPTNCKDTFIGYIVHVWWWLHRHMPRFGEIIAFRNILKHIPEYISVDEAYIEAWFEKGGYKLKLIADAIIHNKGPETIADLIIQRRRVFNGHARLKDQIGYRVDNFSHKAIQQFLKNFPVNHPQEAFWIAGGVSLELISRMLGMYDMYIKKSNPYIWEQARSTKTVSQSKTKLNYGQ